MKRTIAVKQSKSGAVAHFRTIDTDANVPLQQEPTMTFTSLGTQHIDPNLLDFEEAATYQKSAIVTARPSVAGESLVTVLADGTVETSRDALSGNEMIVTNPGGEQYAVPAETFAKKYQATGGDGVYQAVGKIKAIRNGTGTPVTLMAPWGEEQHGAADCWIAESGDDRYIIGAAEFDETYRLELA